MEKNVIRFEIRNKQDRDLIIGILAHNGFHVWAENIIFGPSEIWNICFEQKPKEEVLMA